MSDDHGKLLDELGDLDWDSALDEWEKNTFVPEVARDAETNRVAGAPDAADEPQPTAGGPQAPAKAPHDSLRNLSSEGTVIAPVPKELHGEAPKPAPPPKPAVPATPGAAKSARAGGGLSQLFAKNKDSVPPPAPPQRGAPGVPRPLPSSSKTRAAPRVSEPDVEPPRSAQDVFEGLRPGRLPSVTRQLTAEAAVARERAIADDGDPTLVGRSLEDAEANVPTGQTQTIGMADAPTVSSRDATEALDDGAPDSETAIGERPRSGSMSDAETATRHPADPLPPLAGTSASPADDEAPTFMRQSPSMSPLDETQTGPGITGLSTSERGRPAPEAAPSVPSTERERAPSRASAVELDGERPVSRWLDEATTTAYRQRALWLDEEARALSDPTERARALLGVSELLALIGENADALAFAGEALELAPDLPLAWRQTRQLMPRDPHALVEALDAEAARSPTPAARAHAMLMAADILRTNGDGDAAVERWNRACKLDPADVRAPTARAALALAQDNHTSAGTDFAENSELVALDRAVATALRLRGAPRATDDVDPMPINDGLRRARLALAGQDVVGAAQAVAEIAAEPALAKGALWLSASLGATHIAGRRAAARSLKTLAGDDEPLARRQLAARGIELGDPELVSAALTDDAPLDVTERAALLALAGQDAAAAVERLAETSPPAALLDALASIALPADADADAALTRARRSAGRDDHRALATLGKLLASKPEAAAIDGALEAVRSAKPADAAPSPAAAGVALEVAVRSRRWDEVSDALSSLPAGAEGSHRHVAAAMVAERAGNRENAKRAWSEALAQGGAHESLVRALATFDDDVKLGEELLRIADDASDGPAAAILRLEALARGELDDDAQSALLEKAHRGAPALGIAAFLAERIGRRKGDLDEVLRWIQERRAYANDPLETALDAVREALLVADRDADLASTRLEEAHRARPDDVALRELYERLATEPPADRGEWREKRAEKSSGPTRAVFFTEAALEHERAGDHAGSLRAARQARDAGDTGLSRLAAERAELETGDATRQIEDLIALSKETEDGDVRREALERLADVDGFGRKNPAAALLWHRAILDGDPAHKPSLRYVEHVLIGEGRDAELETHFEQVALALDGSGGEASGHAQLAARLQGRAAGGWERTSDMARLGATQPEPSLWSLRALNAHARVQKDENAILETTVALIDRTQRPAERAALLLRASEAAARLEDVKGARAFLEQAANEDPGDVVTWGFLAEVRERGGETRAAAEACESLARTSVVPDHQLLAWFDAARIWLDEVKDAERGMSALEQCAEIDVTHADVFNRLSGLYAEKHLDAELARLLEKRLASVDDEGERVGLEVELSRALAEMGEIAKAKTALENALAQRPDHTTALAAMADLCAKEGDWSGAEQAYVRLARLLATPEEQRAIYEKLGELYSVHTVNLSRAEVAYKEVLKRAPKDSATLEKLVDVYKRQGDVARAVETQQQMVAESEGPDARLKRLIDLAAIHETTARDARKAEQVLESARKEFPTSVVALRAMAEFYARQRQMPAMQILLDRAAGDARRSFAAGRFVTSLFEVLHAAYELRGRKDAARVVAATLAAVEGQPAELVGAEARAVDPRLDDVLAPETVGPALRALLFRAGDALDAVSPLDLRQLRAAPLVPGTPIGTTVGAIATVVGLGALQILVSPQLGRVAIPLSSNPPTLLVGEGLMNVTNERARAFVVVRAMKMILSRSSALLRGQTGEVGVLVSALFTAFNPSFVPQGVDPKRVAEVSRRVMPALPRNLDPTVGVIALEAAGALGTQTGSLGAAAAAWANRVALLAIGDPGGALDAIAWQHGEDAAPKGSEERAAWIARTVEARELMTFSVTDPYAEARTRLGLDR
ncbi:MAG: hypothetical protein KF819_08190 [Labilithrix sp.]|nr:hypothetical protein [Labilithrix sp.]